MKRYRRSREQRDELCKSTVDKLQRTNTVLTALPTTAAGIRPPASDIQGQNSSNTSTSAELYYAPIMRPR